MSSYERELEETREAPRPATQTPELPDAQRLASTVGNQAFSALAR
jgi:hypothetical protein